MSVLGFQKKSLDGGGVSSIQVYFEFLEIINLQSP